MVHGEPVALRDQGYCQWDELLDHIGTSSLTASPGYLLAEMMHAPAVRTKGLVLHGPLESGVGLFQRAVGELLVSDGYLAPDHASLVQQAYTGRRLVIWEGPSVADEELVEFCLKRDTDPLPKLLRDRLNDPDPQQLVPGHVNRFHWLETHLTDPARHRRSFETFGTNDRSKKMSWSDWMRYLEDEREAFYASLKERHVRHPSMYLKC